MQPSKWTSAGSTLNSYPIVTHCNQGESGEVEIRFAIVGKYGALFPIGETSWAFFVMDQERAARLMALLGLPASQCLRHGTFYTHFTEREAEVEPSILAIVEAAIEPIGDPEAAELYAERISPYLTRTPPTQVLP